MHFFYQFIFFESRWNEDETELTPSMISLPRNGVIEGYNVQAVCSIVFAIELLRLSVRNRAIEDDLERRSQSVPTGRDS
jgi:hypothetical protein